MDKYTSCKNNSFVKTHQNEFHRGEQADITAKVSGSYRDHCGRFETKFLDLELSVTTYSNEHLY